MESIIRNINLFVDGRNYAGMADTLTPPVLTRKTEEYRGAGMPAPVDLDMGLERLETSWVMTDYDEYIVGLWDIDDPVSLVFRGAACGHSSNVVKSIVLTMRGKINVLDRGEWGAGEKGSTTITAGLTYYKEEIDGKVIHEIDPLAYVQVIRGVDRMEKIRTALAI